MGHIIGVYYTKVNLSKKWETEVIWLGIGAGSQKESRQFYEAMNQLKHWNWASGDGYGKYVYKKDFEKALKYYDGMDLATRCPQFIIKCLDLLEKTKLNRLYLIFG